MLLKDFQFENLQTKKGFSVLEKSTHSLSTQKIIVPMTSLIKDFQDYNVLLA